MARSRNIGADCGGATAIEYSLVAGLIALAIIGALSQLGSQSNGMFAQVHNEVEDAMGSDR